MDYRPCCNGNNLMREKAVVMTRLPKARVIVFKRKTQVGAGQRNVRQRD